MLYNVQLYIPLNNLNTHWSKIGNALETVMDTSNYYIIFNMFSNLIALFGVFGFNVCVAAMNQSTTKANMFGTAGTSAAVTIATADVLVYLTFSCLKFQWFKWSRAGARIDSNRRIQQCDNNYKCNWDLLHFNDKMLKLNFSRC